MSFITDFINAAKQKAQQFEQNYQNDMSKGPIAAPIQAVAQTFAPQQYNEMASSPVGEVLQGNFNQVVPAVQRENQQLASGQYKPQIAVGGEMSETPNAGFDPMTGLPKAPVAKGAPLPPVQNSSFVDKNGNPLPRPEPPASANPPDQPTEMGSYTFSDKTSPNGTYTSPKMEPNPNPQSTQYSQNYEMPGTGYTKEDQQEYVQGSSPTKPSASSQQAAEPSRTFPAGNTSKGDVVENQKRFIQIDGKDVNTPNEVDQINATLNGYGIKGPLTNQLQMVNDTIGTLSNKAKNIVATQGGTIDKDQLVQGTIQNLNHSLGQHKVDARSIPYEADSYINRLYARATGQDPITTAAPDQIPGSVVQDMKKLMNEDASSTFGIDDPTKYTYDQAISRYSRDATDEVLDKEYPQASKLNNDMSDLYKAKTSLRKGANQEGAAAQKQANTPPEPRNLGSKFIPSTVLGTDMKPFQNLFNTATNSPKGLKISGGLGLIGLGVGAKSAYDQLYNPSQKQTNAQESNGSGNTPNNGIDTHTTGLISHSYGNINPDGGLPQNAPQGSNQRHYMSEAEYQQQLQQIGSKFTYGTPDYNNAKAQLEAQYNNDQAQAQEVFKGNNIKNFMDNASQYVNDGQTVKDTLANLPPGFWNGVSKAGSIRAYNDPQYQAERQQIANFNNEYTSAYEAATGQKPTDDMLLSSANSPKQAGVKLRAMMQNLIGKYGDYLAPYLAVTSATGTQTNYGTPQSLPQTPPAFPQAPTSVDIGGGSAPDKFNSPVSP